MSSPFIGEIRMFGGSFNPAGWAMCNGALMPISENDALFTLIGTTYGGDGQSTFGLPDLQGRVPIHVGGAFTQLGENGGTESVTLTTNQIPSHSHPVMATTNPGSATQPQNNLTAQNASVTIYRAQAPVTGFNAQMVTGTGGSQAHDNMQPYLVITYIISLFGIFPSQT